MSVWEMKALQQQAPVMLKSEMKYGLGWHQSLHMMLLCLNDFFFMRDGLTDLSLRSFTVLTVGLITLVTD